VALMIFSPFFIETVIGYSVPCEQRKSAMYVP